VPFTSSRSRSQPYGNFVDGDGDFRKRDDTGYDYAWGTPLLPYTPNDRTGYSGSTNWPTGGVRYECGQGDIGRGHDSSARVRFGEPWSVLRAPCQHEREDAIDYETIPGNRGMDYAWPQHSSSPDGPPRSTITGTPAQRVKVDRYDGQAPWHTYMRHFELVASMNG
jgi:hypothetical protein